MTCFRIKRWENKHFLFFTAEVGLTHLGLPADFPKFTAAAKAPQTCGPPDEQSQPDPKGDLYEVIEPARADD